MSKGPPTETSYLLGSTLEQRARWQECADMQGVKLAVWIRGALDMVARDQLGSEEER